MGVASWSGGWLQVVPTRRPTAGWGAPGFRDLWIRRQDVHRLHTDGSNHMTRYKGRTSFKSLERDFPHIVEMIVPEGGFGRTLDAMYDFHARHGIRAINSTGRRDEYNRDYIRWCFADPKLAEAFASAFKWLCTS